MSKQLTVEAKVDKLDEVLGFVGGILDDAECSMKARIQIDVAVEEIFVNIAHYAYEGSEGTAEIIVHIEDSPKTAVMEFRDSGVRFDPLERPDPDTTLSADQRQIGGLGIFLVRNIMDSVKYARKEGKNILSMTKNI